MLAFCQRSKRTEGGNGYRQELVGELGVEEREMFYARVNAERWFSILMVIFRPDKWTPRNVTPVFIVTRGLGMFVVKRIY